MNLKFMSFADDSEIVHLRKAEVPAYLQRGEFFRSLGDDAVERIGVPANTVKPTTTIDSDDDLHYLLLSLSYWVVPVLPLSVMQYVISNSPECPKIDDRFMRQFSVLEKLVTVRNATDGQKVETALKTGNLVIIHYLIKAGFRGPSNITALAAEMGRVDLVRFFHEQGYALSSCTISLAALVGSWECMEYAHQNGAPWHMQTTAIAAARGSLRCLSYAHQHGCPWASHTIENAIKLGSLDCLQYALVNRCPQTSDLARYAAECGQLECLKYLHEHGARLHRLTLLGAVVFGQLECLRYLRSCNCPWDNEACRLAALNGRLDCLKYLHESGCPWDGGTTLAAALCGQFPCLEYAYTHGCDLREDCLRVLGQYELQYRRGVAVNSSQPPPQHTSATESASGTHGKAGSGVRVAEMKGGGAEYAHSDESGSYAGSVESVSSMDTDGEANGYGQEDEYGDDDYSGSEDGSQSQGEDGEHSLSFVEIGQREVWTGRRGETAGGAGQKA